MNNNTEKEKKKFIYIFPTVIMWIDKQFYMMEWTK